MIPNLGMDCLHQSSIDCLLIISQPSLDAKGLQKSLYLLVLVTLEKKYDYRALYKSSYLHLVNLCKYVIMSMSINPIMHRCLDSLSQMKVGRL